MTDTVQLIIEIPEDKAERLLAQMRLDRNFSECKITPLQKHGRVIDESKITKCEQVGLVIKDGNVTRCLKTDAPTIIEANHRRNKDG